MGQTSVHMGWIYAQGDPKALRANQLPPDHPQSDLKAVAVGKGCDWG
jgi:hypothetical protein